MDVEWDWRGRKIQVQIEEWQLQFPSSRRLPNLPRRECQGKRMGASLTVPNVLLEVRRRIASEDV